MIPCIFWRNVLANRHNLFLKSTELAATSLEWVVINLTLNKKSRCTLQNMCISGLIMIKSLLDGGVTKKMTVWRLPKKWPSVGGHGKKMRTEWGSMVIRNWGSKPPPPKNERPLSSQSLEHSLRVARENMEWTVVADLLEINSLPASPSRYNCRLLLAPKIVRLSWQNMASWAKWISRGIPQFEVVWLVLVLFCCWWPQPASPKW